MTGRRTRASSGHVASFALSSLFLSAAWLCGPASISAEGVEPGPGLSAVYETRIETTAGKRETRRWTFSRRGRELEYRFADGDVSERWLQDVRANISCTRIFHAEKTAVRYTSGDLLAFGVTPDWTRLSQVVAPPTGAGLTAGKRLRVLGWEAERFRGPLAPGGAAAAKPPGTLEILWIAALGIPAEVRFSAPGRPRVRVRLVELNASAPDAADLRHYRQIDVTDFGDMEKDPFVRRHHDDPLPAAVPSLALQRAR
jgi:hypothetical protein